MIRGLITALAFAALYVVVSATASLAQDRVSLVGFEAQRDGASAVLVFKTTGEADFRVERFTRGEFINVWSSHFALAEGVDEIPLDFDRPELNDIVTGVSMVQGQSRASIRVYLGPNADKCGASISADGDSTRLTIPGLSSVPPAAGPGPGMPVAEEISASYTPPSSLRHEGQVQAADQISETGDSLDNLIAMALNPEAEEPMEQVLFDFPGEDPVAQAQLLDTRDLGSGRPENVSASTSASEDESVTEKEEPTTEKRDFRIKRDEEFYAPDSYSTGRESVGAQATDSFGSEEFNAAASPKTGKDALSSYKIDLFEIINTPLGSAITLLVAPTDYNVIVDSSVDNNMISLSFKDKQTDLRSALDLITRVYSLEYIVEANTIVVAPKDKMAGNLMAYETELFILNYADPISVRDMLVSTGMAAESEITVYAGEKLVADNSGDPEGILNVDSQVLSSTTGFDPDSIKRIGTNISSTPRNAIFVKALPADMKKISDLIKEFDRKPKIIELEVRVCEATETALESVGLDTFDGLDDSEISTSWGEQGGKLADTNGDGVLEEIFEAFSAGSFHRSPMSFQATLNLEIQSGNINVLAQPTLTTVEGKQAIYFAGESIPYISQINVTPSGQVQQQIDFLPVGVTLNFKPRLDEDGLLTIDVNPVVSSLLEFRLIGGQLEAPRTSTRQLATTVRVADQESFVMAGLISDVERHSMSKIPLLGDLPFLGKLFRKKDVDDIRTEIIIVVTPRIRE